MHRTKGNSRPTLRTAENVSMCDTQEVELTFRQMQVLLILVFKFNYLRVFYSKVYFAKIKS